MKFKDLRPGMMVAIGTPVSVLGGDAKQAIIMEVGGWNDRDIEPYRMFTNRTQSRFYQGGGRGVAIATNDERVRGCLDGKVTKHPRWRAKVVQAGQISCPWDKALDIYKKGATKEKENRKRTLAKRRETKAVAAHLVQMGVQFDLNERSITLDLDQMGRLEALLVQQHNEEIGDA